MGLISEFEAVFWRDNRLVAGIDEAGRGPMAGPLVVAAVVFPIGYDHDLINDSKKISEKKRLELREIILVDALWYEIKTISEAEIDALNIYRATQLAMGELAENAPADHILTDAMPLIDTQKEFTSIIKGDARSLSIAAASILAKTSRDALMYELDIAYPEYGFKNHKGYGTKKHKEAIQKYGRTKHHRQSFKFKDEL